jgi:hypothetical protein
MKNIYTPILKKVATLIFCVLFSLNLNAQNTGFEATPATTPPNNWTAVTGTWTVTTNPAQVRSGTQAMTITDPATSGTTLGTTNPFVTTTTAGNYLIVMGWGKSNTASNALFYLGYRTGTTNTLNPTTTTSGQAANINDATWSRVTSVSAATVAAGTYGVSLRAFRSASTANTQLYIDDIIMYASPSNVPDYDAPSPANTVLLSGNTITWNNGTDNGTPASGIAGVVIIRANGSGLTAPSLNPQAMYSKVNGAAGTNTIVDGANTWTVIGTVQGTSLTSYTDSNATGGPYTYAVYMRDFAYNYSTGVVTVPASPCTNPPTPGAATSSATGIICPGQQVSLVLTGNSFGLNQTYQWQSSSTLNGPYTSFGTAQSGSAASVNPMVTTFYRCEIICSGGTPAYSSPVEVTVTSGYSGTYTINASQATGGSNYQTFADAIAALTSCGVTGPVVYNVDSASGPFTSQVQIPIINGASASNRVTFNGNGAHITFLSTNTNERAGIKLVGADYVTINNFNITATGTATTEYGFGIQLINNADHNNIINNKININQTSTSTANYAGIVVNSSNTAITTAGVSLCDSNLIQGNRISGGNTGIALVANGATSVIFGNIVRNNTIEDFYTHGVYVNGTDRVLIEGNRISRPNRATVAIFNGIFFTGVSTNANITKNKIYNPFGASAAATVAGFGIYLNASSATVGNENVISNNVVYDFIGATGNKNGVLLNNSSNVKVYHNTIYLNDVNATCTACAVRGIYVQNSGTTGLDFRNNNIDISSAGTASKQCVFFEPTSVANYTLENNNYLMRSITGTQNEIARVGGSSTVPATGTGYLTVADWEVGSTKEQFSTSIDPLYINPAVGNFEPTSGSLNNTGVGVGILTDINGTTRSSLTPDVGAYEFGIFVAGLDVSAENIVAPSITASGCYTATEAVSVRVRNSSLQTINFATNPVTIHVNVTGPFVNSFSKVINTDTLATNGFIDVLMNNTIDLSLTGTYTITAYTSLTGDSNINNDTVIVTRTKTNVVAGIAKATPDVICVTPTAPQLSATGVSGYTGLQWQESTTPGTGYTDIVGATSLNYTVPSNVSTTTYYRLAVTCGAVTNYSLEDTLVLSNPQLLSTTAASRCDSGTLTLQATANAGSDIKWYAAASGGTVLGTGTSFTTPTLQNTTNYYVAAEAGSLAGNVGPVSPSAVSASGGGTSAAITTYYMEFEVLSATTINSVDIFPTAAIGTNGTITIQTTSGATIGSASYTTTVTGGQTKQTVNLNIALSPGIYRMGQLAPAIALYRNTDGAVYPYTSSAIKILSNNFAANYYYYFFNWNFGTGCSSPRTQVTATIQSSPSATLSYPGSPYCANTTTVSPTITGSTGGKFKSTAGLVIDSVTGVIDVANSALGTYTIQYTIAANGSCPAFTTSTTITKTTPPTATIAYAGSPYCSNAGPSASVTLTGATGGIFTSTAGLIINSTTGLVNLTASTPGTYTVDYTVLSVGSCPAFTTSTTIIINASESATINYPGNPYCSSLGNISVLRTGSANGKYSSSAGLVIDSLTGVVNISASTPGTYVVNYTIAANSQCPAFVASANIIITAAANATIHYHEPVYCLGQGTAEVHVTGTQGGTFSSSAGIDINSLTGEVSLVSSTPGTYLVSYTIAANAGCPSFTTTTAITLRNAATASISYPASAYCVNGGSTTPTRTGEAGGKYTSTAGLAIDSLTGTINLNNSQAGTYVISYTIAGIGNCNAFTANATVTINALPDGSFTYTLGSVNPRDVQFTSVVSTGHSHAWNFGDPNSNANTSTLVNPLHTFSADGTFLVSHTITNVANTCTDTEIDTVIVNSVGLTTNRNTIQRFLAQPNPFSNYTTIIYELSENSNVSLEVYDLLGRKIRTLQENVSQSAGKHSYEFTETELVTDGVYLLKLNVNGNLSVFRLMEIK